MSDLLPSVVGRLLAAPALMIAAALLVGGYAGVGDGFSAGVVAALAVLMQYVTLGYRNAERLLPGRWAPGAAFAGVLLALLVALVPLVAGRPLLTHWPGPDAPVTTFGKLELMTPVLFDVGVALLVFGSVVGLVRVLAAAADRGPA